MEGYMSVVKQIHAATASAGVFYTYYLGWSTQVDYHSKTPSNSILMQWVSPKMLQSSASDYLHFSCTQTTSS